MRLMFARGVGLALLLAPGAAWAGSDTDTFTVSATVIDSCDVNANDLSFGNYDPVSSTPLDAATTLVITCTNGTDYEVALDEGQGAGATVNARKMEQGAELLTYTIYSNAGRTNVWGETSGGNTVEGVGDGTPQTLDVYGRVPVNQTARAGPYSDSITVTVTY